MLDVDLSRSLIMLFESYFLGVIFRNQSCFGIYNTFWRRGWDYDNNNVSTNTSELTRNKNLSDFTKENRRSNALEREHWVAVSPPGIQDQDKFTVRQVIPVVMAGFIGKIDAFEESTEDWWTYIERVDQYFIENDTNGDKKVPALMGSKTYGTSQRQQNPQRSLTTKSWKPSKITYLPNYWLPQKGSGFTSVNKTKVRTGLRSYVAELRKLTEHCNFGDYLNDALRDRHVCGIRNENTQKRLLSTPELTLTKVVNIVVAMETAPRDAEELQGTRLPLVLPSVHGVLISSYRCGNSDHSANTCRFKSETCRRCGKQGHNQRVCRSKPKSTSPPGQPSKRVNPKKPKQREIHAVQSASYSDSEDFDDVLGNIKIHSIKYSKSSVIFGSHQRLMENY